MKYKISENRLRNLIRESVTNVLNENAGGIEILPDGNYERGTVYRPHFCYADGRLEDDLGEDFFCLSASPARGGGDSLPTGKYPCSYNGKPCTLYVVNMGSGRHHGLCCYDDDMESKARILDQLFFSR